MMYNLCKVNVHSKENWALAIVGRRNLNSQAGNAKKKKEQKWNVWKSGLTKSIKNKRLKMKERS